MGYDTAAAVGDSYVQHLGYEYELLGRHWNGNVWELAYKVRRGQESGELKLKVDALTQEITEAEEKNAAVDAGNPL